MKAYKIELLVIDHDRLGPTEIATVVEQTTYPNRCITPLVMEIVAADIGEWSDSNLLNYPETLWQEYKRLFPAP